MSKEIVETAKTELSEARERTIRDYVKTQLRAIEKAKEDIEDLEDSIDEKRALIEKVENGDYSDIAFHGTAASFTLKPTVSGVWESYGSK